MVAIRIVKSILDCSCKLVSLRSTFSCLILPAFDILLQQYNQSKNVMQSKQRFFTNVASSVTELSEFY